VASLKELQDQIDDQQETMEQVQAILEDAYTPEATRSDLASAVGQALDVLGGEDTESGDDDEEG